MENKPNTPLLPLFLGPLTKRTVTTFNFENPEQEDKPFIEGLNRVLDNDIAAGRIDAKTLLDCAVTTTIYMVPPRSGLASNGRITPVQWPKPGEPWHEIEGADVRERLLARMVHQGLDPWSDPRQAAPSSALLGSTFAGTWLSYGYPNLMRLAMRMVPGAWDADAIASDREAHYGKKPSLLQAAVTQDFTDIVKAGLDLGGSTTGLLHRASSTEMVRLLIGAGCSVEEIVDAKRGKDVIKHWLEKHSAKTARTLMQVVQDQMTPRARFEQAANGILWAPLSDAMAAWPEWKDATSKLGNAHIRTGLGLLMRSIRSKPDRIKQALRLLSKAPVDDREVAPGLTEMSLYRLTLARLMNEPSRSNSVASDQMDIQLAALMKKAYAGKNPSALLSEDAAALLARSDLLAHTIAGVNLAGYLFEHGHVLPHETSKPRYSVASERTVDDLVTLGRACKLRMRPEPFELGDRAMLTIYGCLPSMLAQKRLMAGDDTFRWIDQLARKNPDRIDEITTAALCIVGMSLGVRLKGSQPKGDIWKADMQRVERLFDEGAMPLWTQKDCEVLQKITSYLSTSEYAKRFAAQLPGRMERCQLAAKIETLPRPNMGATPGSSRRL